MLTKSTLMARDLQVFQELDRGPGASVAMSINTLNDGLRQLFEPDTPPAQSRLEVLRRFACARISTTVLVAPILPFLTDGEHELEELLRACASAGVKQVAGIALHIKPGIRPHFWPWLREAQPDLYPAYRSLYGNRTHAPQEYLQEIAERFTRVRDRLGLEGSPHRLVRSRPPEPQQLALAV